MSKFISSQKRPAFTLVELLVVIGIITILISILLPALNKVRQSANRVKCASNLHQVAMGLQMYANSNRGFFPGSFGPYGHELISFTQPDGTRYATQRLGTLLGDWNSLCTLNSSKTWADAFTGPSEQPLQPAESFLPAREILVCPESGMGGYFTYSTDYLAARFCGYSYCVPKSAAPDGGWKWTFWRPNQLIPEGTIGWDNFSTNNARWKAIAACYIEDPRDTATGGETIGHQTHADKGVNVLYFDGSVQWVPRPTSPLPAGLGMGLKNLYGTLIPANVNPGWPERIYDPGSPGGNSHDYYNFWPYVNALYR